MVRIGILLILLGCSTDNNNLQSPPDTKKAILELNEIQVQPEDQIKKERVLQVLKDCGSYSLEAYEKYIQCTSEQSTLKTHILSLEKELIELKKELRTWKYIKYGFYSILLLYVLYRLTQIYLKYKPI
jgi:hypothetical protein